MSSQGSDHLSVYRASRDTGYDKSGRVHRAAYIKVPKMLLTIGGHGFISNVFASGAAELWPFVFTARFGAYSWGSVSKKLSK